MGVFTADFWDWNKREVGDKTPLHLRVFFLLPTKSGDYCCKTIWVPPTERHTIPP